MIVVTIYALVIGAWCVSRARCADNSQSQVWGNDREMMTCDGGGGAFFGHVTPLSPTSVRTSHGYCFYTHLTMLVCMTTNEM